MYIFTILAIILSCLFIKKYYSKKYSNYLYHQYQSCQHVSHFIKEDYLKMCHKATDRQVFLDLELEGVFECIDYTRTTIGGEYILGSLCYGNDKLEFQERYIAALDKYNIKKILYLFHRLEKDNVSLFDFKEQIQSLHLKYIVISIILITLLLFSLMLLCIDINYLKYVLIIFFINIIYGNSFLIRYCGTLHEQIEFILKICITLQGILKTNLKKEICQDTIQSINQLSQSLKIERVYNLLKSFDIFDIFTIFDTVFFIRYFQAYFIKKKIEQFYENLIVCYEEIGLIDQSLSVKILRENFKTCIPERSDEKKLIIEKGYHPLIKNPVKNSLNIENHVIITGSNASGKSTFLRVIGINFVLAHAIHTCYAKRFVYYPYQLLTAIHIKDDILAGYSYYYAEIKGLETICRCCTNDENLILIDEILKGTNEMERIKIAYSILSYLFERDSLVIVTTHDLALAKAFQVDHYCFYDTFTSAGIQFDYKIKKGICNTSNAIALMKQMSFDDKITQLL